MISYQEAFYWIMGAGISGYVWGFLVAYYIFVIRRKQKDNNKNDG